MPTPTEILDIAFERANINLKEPTIDDPEIIQLIDMVCHSSNKAGTRLLLACALAKTHNHNVDIRKPYTELRTPDAYSGRTYDEQFVNPFINKHQLPCNPTSAFLTPALRNGNVPLTRDLDLVGRPPTMYKAALQLLDDIYTSKITAEALLVEIIRVLIVIKSERQQRMDTLIASLKATDETASLSAEAIVQIIEQHLKAKGASRLPVLVVAAAYRAAVEYLQEYPLPLKGHNAADEQTGALGDVEVTLMGDDEIVTSYEMKNKKVLRDDIDRALQKLTNTGKRVDNYIFITTDTIDDNVQDYAKSMYDRTGVEFVILDCISFVRHFLHLFHRLRMKYLDAYQELVLQEPESAVGQPLKELFLALRQAASS